MFGVCIVVFGDAGEAYDSARLVLFPVRIECKWDGRFLGRCKALPLYWEARMMKCCIIAFARRAQQVH